MIQNYIKFTLSSILLYFVVITPMRANLLAATVFQNSIDGQSAINLYVHAMDLDKCNSSILNALGDTYIRQKNNIMAAIAYGRALVCSPADALLRFKFGESLLMDGFPQGFDNVREALTLEPNNPFFKAEYDRLSGLLSPSHE